MIECYMVLVKSHRFKFDAAMRVASSNALLLAMLSISAWVDSGLSLSLQIMKCSQIICSLEDSKKLQMSFKCPSWEHVILVLLN